MFQDLKFEEMFVEVKIQDDVVPRYTKCYSYAATSHEVSRHDNYLVHAQGDVSSAV